MHLKFALITVAVSTLFLNGLAFAQAPAGSTAVCKDGTYSSAASKRGACSGHKGVGQWLGGSDTAAMNTPVSSPAQPQVPAGATATCKDGTYSSAASKQGACSGHKGVGQWLGRSEPTGTKAPAAASSAPMTPAASQPASSMKQSQVAPPAAMGGNGQVWVNTASRVYHCQGDRWYGKTKAGSYMSESAAVSSGARPDHGKACR
jgi:hypothetical protein